MTPDELNETSPQPPQDDRISAPETPEVDDIVPLAAEPEPEVAPATATAKPTAERPQSASAPVERLRRPIVRSTHYEWVLAVAGCTAAVLVVAALLGQRGLFPLPVPSADGSPTSPVDPSLADKLMVALRSVVRIILGGGALVAGAYFLHFLDRRPVGDLRALASRMLAIAALALLVTLVPFDTRILKQAYDVLIPVGAAWGLMILFFRLSARDAGVIMLGAFIAITVLALGSKIVALAVF